jgi:hypothetical protein
LNAAQYLHGAALKFTQDVYGIRINELGKRSDENDSVIVLDFSGEVESIDLVKR